MVECIPDGRLLAWLVFHGSFPGIHAGDRALRSGQDVIEEPAGASAFERADLEKVEIGLLSVRCEVFLEAGDVPGKPINGEGGGHFAWGVGGGCRADEFVWRIRGCRVLS